MYLNTKRVDNTQEECLWKAREECKKTIPGG